MEFKVAIKTNDLEHIKYLVTNKHLVPDEDDILRVCMYGQLDIIKFLAGYCDLSVCDNMGIRLACYYCQWPTVQFLLRCKSVKNKLSKNTYRRIKRAMILVI